MTETRETRLKAIEDTLKDIQKSLKNPKEILEAIAKVEKEIKNIKHTVSEILADQKILKEIQDKQDQEIKTMQADNRVIRNEISELRDYMEAQEREKRKTWIEFTGIPEVNNENLGDVILKVHAASGIQEGMNGIVETYRKKNMRNNASPIVVKYATAELREKVKKAVRTAKVKLSDTGIAENDKPIFANDCLSKRIANLFWKVRRARYDKKWHSAWTARNKIFIRINQADVPIYIKEEQELINLLK